MSICPEGVLPSKDSVERISRNFFFGRDVDHGDDG